MTLTTAFLQALESEMNTLATSEQRVTIMEVPKNNGIILHGVCISRKGHSCAPNVYLENYVNENTNLKAIHEIARDIYGTAMSYQGNANKYDNIAETITDFKAIKDKIYPRLVNRKANEKLLWNLVWEPFLDLAIIYSVDFEKTNDGVASVKVTKELFEKWGISETILHNQAMLNMNLEGACYMSMMEMLMGMAPSKDFSFMEDEPIPMYVVTNQTKVNGAIYFLCEDVMKNLAEKMHVNKLYMIPSSVHEVIIVPDGEMKAEELTRMVIDVNSTEVSPEEVLSDHVYVWKNGELNY